MNMHIKPGLFYVFAGTAYQLISATRKVGGITVDVELTANATRPPKTYTVKLKPKGDDDTCYVMLLEDFERAFVPEPVTINVTCYIDAESVERHIRGTLRNKSAIQRRVVEAMRAEFPKCGLAPDYFLAPGSVWKNRSTFDLVRVLEIDYLPERRVKYYYLDSNVAIKRETNGFLSDFQYVGPDIYAAMASRIYRPERIVAKHVALGERYHSGGVVGLRPGEVPAILRRGEEVKPMTVPTVGTRWARKDNGVHYKVQSCDFMLRGDSFEHVSIHLVPSNQLAMCTCTVEGPLEVFYEHFEPIP